MNKNLMIGLIVLVLVIGGGALLMRGNSANVQNESMTLDDDAATGTSEIEDDDDEAGDDDEDDSEGVMTEGVKSFEVSGSNYTFDTKEIKVKQGDTVQIVFENEDGMHDWNLDEFKAKTKVLKAGETETIEFVANQKGTFEYYCSVGQHRANGMVGNLIVE